MKHLLILATMLVVSAAYSVNFCGQNSCCSTQTCNSCANNCHLQCASQSCTHNCIDNCIKTVPQICGSGACNVCSESQCCNSQNCNTCANTCTSQCSTQSCRNDCVNNCMETPPKCVGANCNACSGSQCCNSQYCNKCANTCSNQCSTPTCTNNCVNKCIESTPSCVGENCSVCVGGQCCNNDNCNSCVNQCYNQTSGCTKACVRECIQPDPIKVVLPIPERECENEIVPSFGSSGNSSNIVNVTNDIQIHHTINNTNIIHVPIHVNNTNINSVNYARVSKTVNKEVTIPSKIETLNNHTKDGCCYVLHPRECFYEKTNQSQPQIKCIRRRHRECSSICSSSVVLLAPQPRPIVIPQPYPVPYPVQNQQQRCHYVQQYPWVYCGNYQKYDCGSCYNCGQGYSPQKCSVQPQCPLMCRSNLYRQ